MSNLFIDYKGTMRPLWELVLGGGSPQQIYNIFHEGECAPLLLDLIAKGKAAVGRDRKYREFALGRMEIKEPVKYKSYVATMDSISVSAAKYECAALSNLADTMKSIFEEYAASVLSKFMFGGKELGKMTRDEVRHAIAIRKERSETEVKQVHFLETILERMTQGDAVMDSVDPAEANRIWGIIDNSYVLLADNNSGPVRYVGELESTK